MEPIIINCTSTGSGYLQLNHPYTEHYRAKEIYYHKIENCDSFKHKRYETYSYRTIPRDLDNNEFHHRNHHRIHSEDEPQIIGLPRHKRHHRQPSTEFRRKRNITTRISYCCKNPGDSICQIYLCLHE